MTSKTSAEFAQPARLIGTDARAELDNRFQPKRAGLPRVSLHPAADELDGEAPVERRCAMQLGDRSRNTSGARTPS